MLNSTVAALRGVLGASTALSPSLGARAAAHLFCTPFGSRRVHPHETGAPFAERLRLAGPLGDVYAYGWMLDRGRPTVLFAHGWGGWGLQFAPWVEPLLEAGYAVVSFDQPAHGWSAGSTADGIVFQRTLALVAASIGPIDAIVGHSFGAAMAAMATTRGLATRALVMIASPVDLVDATEGFARNLGLSAAAGSRMRELLEARVGAALDTISVRRIGPLARTPVLVIHDRQDREVPISAAAEVARHWAAPVETHCTSGLGHRRIVNDDAVIARAIDYIDREPARAQRARRTLFAVPIEPARSGTRG